MEISADRLLKITIFLGFTVLLGIGMVLKPHQSPYNAIREAIISNGYISSPEILNPLKTQNYTINDSELSSINSTLFVRSETLANLDDINPIVYDVIWCESKGDHSAIGDLNYEYQAFGIAQFQIRTFNWLKELSGYYNLRIENEKDQIILLNWAINNDFGYLWSCY
jgi:hypothetical protein